MIGRFFKFLDAFLAKYFDALVIVVFIGAMMLGIYVMVFLDDPDRPSWGKWLSLFYSFNSRGAR
jgi:hypothetical protein